MGGFVNVCMYVCMWSDAAAAGEGGSSSSSAAAAKRTAWEMEKKLRKRVEVSRYVCMYVGM